MPVIRITTIKRKLIMIGMLTTGSVLILSTSILIINGYLSQRQSLVNEMIVQAKIVGANCKAALSFDDQKSAKETLGALKASPNIISAAIYSGDGKVFAALNYKDAKEELLPPSVPQSDGHYIGIKSLNIFHGIFLDGERIGTIYIRLGLKGMYASLMWYAGTVGVVANFSLGIAFLMLLKLQKKITTPILSLRQATDKIAEGDLTTRVEVLSCDELGGLAASFNSMTDNLQETTVSRNYVDGVINNMMDCLIVVSDKGNIQTVNQAALKLLCYKNSELLNKPLEIIIERGLPINKLIVNHLLINESTGIVEKNLLTKDGRKIPVLFSASLMRSVDGNIQGIVCVATDITERKKAEIQISKLFSAVEQCTVSIVITDTNGTIEYVNPEFSLITGYSFKEAIGQNPRVLKSGEHGPEVYKELWETITSGKVWYGELHNKKKSGELYWESVSISPVRDTRGVITHFVGVKEDITERRKAEDQIKASLKEKEILLQEIHHRVKNNLQVIISLLSLQSKDIKDQKILKMFKESQNRILSISLVHEGIYRSKDLAHIKLEGYVKKLTRDLLQSYKVNEGIITLKIDVEDMSIGIDTSIPCGLIINELLSNSLKHAFPEKGKGEIDIKIHRIGDSEIEMIFRDNGVGLPEKYDFRDSSGFGFRMIIDLVEYKLMGRIDHIRERSSVSYARGEGTEFQIKFKEIKYKNRI